MTQPRVAELTLAAADYVRRAVGLDLDGSVESLAYVDHYLSQAGEVDERVLPLVAGALGAYFGDVVVAHIGGTWHADSADPGEWLLTLDAVPLSFRPVALAVEALRRASVEGYDATLTTLSTLDGQLSEALAASGPVEEDYYYSLTGRYETIEHAAAILAELRRQGDLPPPPDPDDRSMRRPN